MLNRDDERVMAMARRSAEVVTFGTDAPSGGNSYGLLLDNGMTWLAWAEDLSPPGRRRKDERRRCRAAPPRSICTA